ncbi:Outer membrane protein assembly factor YaeT precursor [Indibacter alkaliphilus LW1]|uniref:Outer membrane protein assembly factor YaeT n=1 Tax=Indibacter alkaliphilus (strain CCUG 57479 / KCTC 22604 / LW1) TaxID=1189612 RepID=S2E0N0_INDAL|nr:POTRA domain-containing protein [Indibacter alkaliphilus]EOZ97996.1 Outer membrane protein assembly factor YaeT precursor [Indibacter alkaliphilus LW1]
MKRSTIILFLLFLAGFAEAQIRLGQSRFSSSRPVNILELNYSKPQKFRIAEIKAVGLSTLDEVAVISLSGLRVDDEISVPGDAISGALKRLWGQGIIGDVKILVTKVEGDDIYLLLELTERPRFSRVEFSGVNKTQEGELKDKIKIRGRVVRDDVLATSQRNIRQFFVDKGFLNTEVKVIQERDTTLPNSVKIRFDVDRKSKVKINEVKIYGNEEINDKRLKGKLKNTKEHPRLHFFREMASRITNTTPQSAKEAVVYRNPVTEEEIRNYINKNFKLNFFNASKYVAKDFREDKDNLINFYNSRGYRDAEILADSTYRHSDNTINVAISLEEGRKYYYRNISFVGNFLHEDQILLARLGIDKGDVYNKEKLEKRLNYDPQKGDDVSSLYQDDGYLFFNIDPVEVMVQGDSIDIEMRIFEGPQVTVNSVNIQGNERTSDHVVMREIRILPGQKFNRSLLVRTIRELSQLGYFDPEKIEPDMRPNFEDATVDITFILEERPNDQIELSGGWGGFFGFVGTVGLVFNNFSIKNVGDFSKWRPLPVGDGQKLSLRVQANGRTFQNYSVSLTEPWFGGKKPNALSFSFNHSVQRQIDFRDMTTVQGAFRITGATLGLSKRVTWPDDYFMVSHSLQYQVYDFDRFGEFFGLSYNTGRANSLTFNNTIARNNIDNPIYPRLGSNISLATSFTPPYANLNPNIDRESPDEERFRWLEYHKWMFDATFYTPVFGSTKLVVSARTHMGFLGSYGERIGMIPLERFVLGGDGMNFNNFALGQEIIGLRGYENQAITPGRYERNVGISGVPFGGIAYNKHVMELRYLISPNPSATIFVLGFAEAGNNWGSYADYNPFNLKKSAGVGARIFMPAFGLLGLDWGYGFDSLGDLDPRERNRSGAQFHFTIGQQFR